MLGWDHNRTRESQTVKRPKPADNYPAYLRQLAKNLRADNHISEADEFTLHAIASWIEART